MLCTSRHTHKNMCTRGRARQHTHSLSLSLSPLSFSLSLSLSHTHTHTHTASGGGKKEVKEATSVAAAEKNAVDLKGNETCNKNKGKAAAEAKKMEQDDAAVQKVCLVRVCHNV